jgi:hypothetical protein
LASLSLIKDKYFLFAIFVFFTFALILIVSFYVNS